MPATTPADTSYDRVPYPSWSIPPSHPDRLAAVATLLGLQPTPAAEARVLELGCASGGNLIPLAEAYPGAYFVGIDLSHRQIEGGQHYVASLGLSNMELRHQDILEFPRDEGPFDYIIAHGVFSWVPPQVQEKLLEICRDQLTPHGVAFISYNTYPGWRLRGMIRDMLIYHTRQFSAPEKQLSQARALLHFLNDAVSSESPYGAFLQRELDIFNKVPDEYIFHDHLEGHNTPMYFHEFVDLIGRYELQYLSEPHVSSLAARGASPKVVETLANISKDAIQAEQYMDFVNNRAFRESLICHANISIDREDRRRHLRHLHVASQLEEISTTSNASQGPTTGLTAFRSGKTQITTDSQVLREALGVLGQRWPAAVSFDELLSATVRALGAPAAATDAMAQELADNLIECYDAHVVQLHASRLPLAAEIAERPLASALVRGQAAAGNKVTNRHHHVVRINDATQQILTLLDGTRDESELVEQLCQGLASGAWECRVDGESFPDSDRKAVVAGLVRTTLEALCRSALLVPG